MSGKGGGTSGDFPWPPWLLLVGLTLATLGVNVTSTLIEQPAASRNFAAWEPVVWEASSGIVLVALAPLVWRALNRFPLAPPLWRPLLIHLALTIPFSLAHIALMLALRLLVYDAVGAGYDFFSRGVGTVLVYEWRKDVLSYGLQLGLFWAHARLQDRRPPPAGAEEGLISLRVSGGTVHLRPSAIRMVEAAGNYVEIDAEGRRHLVRGTLAGWEARLGPRFVRIHRSRLVNSALITAERPRPSGDVTLELADGSRIVASRRYRERLPSAQGLPPATGSG